MKIAYSCDNGYIQQTGVSLISLLENNQEIDDLSIYIVSKGISDSNLTILKEISSSYKRELIIIDFDKIAYDLKLSDTGRHIETIYTKIFFSRINNLDKILYIDSDTIITSSLKDIWDIDLSGYYMGMVETYTGKEAKISLQMCDSSPFFNDGVALVNVNFCRDNHLINKCLNLISSYDGMPPILSEGTLNKICEGKIKSILPKYNMMSGLYQLISLNPKYVSEQVSYSIEELKESYKRPVIIHYLSGFYGRPWEKVCTHPLKHEYYKYKSISPWSKLPLSNHKLPFRYRVLGTLLNIIGPYNFNKIRNSLKL